MSEPHLILHRVRGEPAYDIAIKLRCPNCQGVGGHNVQDFETGEVTDYEGFDCDECSGNGFWWIIPTSGHRAYPYREWRLDDLKDTSDINNSGWHDTPAMMDDIPADWPDHYTINPAKGSGEKLNIAALVNNLSAPLKDRRF